MTNTETSRRKTIIERRDVDTGKLYDTLDVAIRYLQEMQKSLPAGASLEEHWIGYEDMSMCFSWERNETDEELMMRLAQEELSRKFAEERAKLDAEKAERRKQWERLQREFGR